MTTTAPGRWECPRRRSPSGWPRRTIAGEVALEPLCSPTRAVARDRLPARGDPPRAQPRRDGRQDESGGSAAKLVEQEPAQPLPHLAGHLDLPGPSDEATRRSIRRQIGPARLAIPQV